jgi:hypothetical protein
MRTQRGEQRAHHHDAGGGQHETTDEFGQACAAIGKAEEHRHRHDLNHGTHVQQGERGVRPRPEALDETTIGRPVQPGHHVEPHQRFVHERSFDPDQEVACDAADQAKREELGDCRQHPGNTVGSAADAVECGDTQQADGHRQVKKQRPGRHPQACGEQAGDVQHTDAADHQPDQPATAQVVTTLALPDGRPGQKPDCRSSLGEGCHGRIEQNDTRSRVVKPSPIGTSLDLAAPLSGRAADNTRGWRGSTPT